MLNACGRIRKAGVGIGICMGDRNTMLAQGEEIVVNYGTTLRNYLSAIFAEKWRLVDDGESVFVNGEGLLTEDMVSAVASILGESPTFSGRLLFVRTLAKSNRPLNVGDSPNIEATALTMSSVKSPSPFTKTDSPSSTKRHFSAKMAER